MKSKQWSKPTTDQSTVAGVILASYGIVAFTIHLLRYLPDWAVISEGVVPQLIVLGWLALDLSLFVGGWRLLQEDKWAYWLSIAATIIASVLSFFNLAEGDTDQIFPILFQVIVLVMLYLDREEFIGKKKKKK